MERLCFLIELQHGAEQEYQRRHDELWPEMHDALKAAGYTNYSLFRRGSTVIGYAECEPDVTTVLETMAASPVTPRWNESFQGIIKRLTDDSGDMMRAAEVWHLD
jgi:L-rhamnose mutarotase